MMIADFIRTLVTAALLALVVIPVIGLVIKRRPLRLVTVFALLVVATTVTRAYMDASRAVAAVQNDLAAQIIDETTAERGQLTVTVSATGSILPLRQVPLMFEASGMVSEILVQEGQQVQAGDVLAQLDAADLESALADATYARDLSQTSLDALTAAPRDVDLAAAQAAVDAAQAAYNAAASSGTTANDREIAQLQAELARNQLWQTQLQRDASNASAGGGAPVDLSGLSGLTTAPFTTSEANQIVSDINAAIDAFNASNGTSIAHITGDTLVPFLTSPAIPPDLLAQINSILSGFSPDASTSYVQQTSQQNAITQAEYGVQIADAQAAAADSHGADLGALGSARAALIQAQVNLDRLVNGPSGIDVRRASIDLQLASLAVQQAQNGIDRMTLTAPFDGRIAQNNLKVGELAPSGPAMLLIDDSGFYVDLPVDETDIVNVQVGQKVTLKLDALPDVELGGMVTRVAIAPVRVGQLVTYAVRVTLDLTEQPVRVGMSATASIVISQLDDALLVRNRFIRIDSTTQQAFITIQRDDGGFEEVPVELGMRNETYSEILGGLQEGQRIVLLPRGTFNPIPGV